jgi:hypothetical protein
MGLFQKELEAAKAGKPPKEVKAMAYTKAAAKETNDEHEEAPEKIKDPSFCYTKDGVEVLKAIDFWSEIISAYSMHQWRKVHPTTHIGISISEYTDHPVFIRPEYLPSSCRLGAVCVFFRDATEPLDGFLYETFTVIPLPIIGKECGILVNRYMTKDTAMEYADVLSDMIELFIEAHPDAFLLPACQGRIIR